MDIYLPVAEMSVNILGLLLLGGVVGFLSGLFGVGGGFLLTPLLTFMGVPPTIAVGTQSCQLAGTSLSGALAHWRKKNIDIQMATVLMAGSFIGTALGVQLFKWLKQIGQINLVIVLGYVSLLSVVGALMFWESAPRLFKGAQRIRKPSVLRATAKDEESQLVHGFGADSSMAMDFPRSRLRVNVFLPLGLGFAGGVLVALFGVGGGFVMVPAMIYILRMPPALVNGTSLFQIMFTTSLAAVLQAVSNHSVDIILAQVLLLGSVVSVPMGARLAWRLKPEVARFLMAALILLVAAKLILDITLTPDQIYSLEMRALSL